MVTTEADTSREWQNGRGQKPLFGIKNGRNNSKGECCQSDL